MIKWLISIVLYTFPLSVLWLSGSPFELGTPLAVANVIGFILSWITLTGFNIISKWMVILGVYSVPIYLYWLTSQSFGLGEALVGLNFLGLLLGSIAWIFIEVGSQVDTEIKVEAKLKQEPEILMESST